MERFLGSLVCSTSRALAILGTELVLEMLERIILLEHIPHLFLLALASVLAIHLVQVANVIGTEGAGAWAAVLNHLDALTLLQFR